MELVNAVQRASDIHPKVLLGGFAVKQGLIPSIPGVTFVTDLSALPID